MAVKYYLHQGEPGTGRTVRIDATDDMDAHRRAANIMAHSVEYGELWKAYTQAPALVTTMAIYPERKTTARLWAHAHATEDRAITAEAAGKSGVDLRRVALNIGEVALMAANDGECYLVRSGVRV